MFVFSEFELYYIWVIHHFTHSPCIGTNRHIRITVRSLIIVGALGLLSDLSLLLSDLSIFAQRRTNGWMSKIILLFSNWASKQQYNPFKRRFKSYWKIEKEWERKNYELVKQTTTNQLRNNVSVCIRYKEIIN